MGCSHSSVKAEPNLSNNIQQNQIITTGNEKQNNSKQIQNNPTQKEIIINKDYQYCYTEEEINKINQILKEKTFENNEIIFHKAIIEINKDFTNCTEFVTIQTYKKDGYKYNASYYLTSGTIIDDVKTYSMKVNNKRIYQIESKSRYSDQLFSVFCSYSLKPEDNSIVTIESNVKIETKLFLMSIARVNFNIYNTSFSFIIKISDEFNYICPNVDPINKLKVISKNEIILEGNKNERNLNFGFKLKNNIILPRNNKAFYFCKNEEEIINLEKALNSIELKFNELIILSVKDYYEIKGGICYVKSFITFFKVHEDNTLFSSNYFFDLDEYDDLKCINGKGNNQQEKISNSNMRDKLEFDINLLKNEYFYTVEYDYSFKLRKQNDNIYIIIIGHNQIEENGYFQLYVKYDKKEIQFSGLSREADFYRNDKEYNFILHNTYKHQNDGYVYNELYFLIKDLII